MTEHDEATLVHITLDFLYPKGLRTQIKKEF